MPVRILVENHDKLTLVGQPLRRLHIWNVVPTSLSSSVAGQPLSLCVSQKQLSVFRRPQQIDAKLLGGSSSECTTVCMISRPFVARAPVWLAGLPIHMLVREPKGFNIHAVQD